MITATRAIRQSRANGKPLPYIPELDELYRQGTVFRQGQIAMICGRPASQKSGMALWMAVKWGLPHLYISGDMSAFTATTRLASIYTGLTSTEVATQLKDNDTASTITDAVAKSPIEFLFSSSPSLDDIDEEINAWVEKYDDYPKVITIDNLIDVAPIAEDPHSNLLALLQELKTMSRPAYTNAFVLAVHHNKVDNNPNYPASERGIQSLVSQTPELILSVALDQSVEHSPVMRIATVKNRSGPCDPTGGRYVELLAEPARTRFTRPSIYTEVARSWQG